MEIILASLILLPILAAPALYLAAKRTSAGFRLLSIIALAELVLTLVLFIPDASVMISLPGLTLSCAGFHSLYAAVSAFAFFVSAVFSVEYFTHYKNHARYIFFYLLTLAATEGVFLSADLISTFVFFELVSFCSFFWVLHDEKPRAVAAAKTYLAVAIFGGMALLLGLLYLNGVAGTLVIDELTPEAHAPFFVGILCLLGFSAKAGLFPLHIWLPRAHPVAPAPASALLSGVLTKVGVYGLIVTSVRLFSGNPAWGTLMLVLGVVTLLLGALLALLSVDLKRTLACSSMSQIGFIATGIAASVILGEKGSLASAGVVLYMLNHTLMKLILFSLSGVVHMERRRLDLNELRGWGRSRPALAALFAWGGLGLAGIPLTGGYLAKTLIHEAIVEAAEAVPLARAAEYLFLLGGGCTLAYMIKLFVVLFVEKPRSDSRKKRRSGPFTSAALALAALPTLFTGIPAAARFVAGRGMAFAGAGEWREIDFFAPGSLTGALVTVTVGVAVYFLFVRTVTRRQGEYVNVLPAWADLESTVYVPMINAVTSALGFVMRLFGENVVTSRLCSFLRRAAELLCHALADVVDAPVYILRRTVFAPSPSDTGGKRRRRHPIVDFIYLERGTDNFSYSLIVTAVGVCVILLLLFIIPRL